MNTTYINLGFNPKGSNWRIINKAKQEINSLITKEFTLHNILKQAFSNQLISDNDILKRVLTKNHIVLSDNATSSDNVVISVNDEALTLSNSRDVVIQATINRLYHARNTDLKQQPLTYNIDLLPTNKLWAWETSHFPSIRELMHFWGKQYGMVINVNKSQTIEYLRISDSKGLIISLEKFVEDATFEILFTTLSKHIQPIEDKHTINQSPTEKMKRKHYNIKYDESYSSNFINALKSKLIDLRNKQIEVNKLLTQAFDNNSSKYLPEIKRLLDVRFDISTEYYSNEPCCDAIYIECVGHENHTTHHRLSKISTSDELVELLNKTLGKSNLNKGFEPKITYDLYLPNHDTTLSTNRFSNIGDMLNFMFCSHNIKFMVDYVEDGEARLRTKFSNKFLVDTEQRIPLFSIQRLLELVYMDLVKLESDPKTTLDIQDYLSDAYDAPQPNSENVDEYLRSATNNTINDTTTTINLGDANTLTSYVSSKPTLDMMTEPTRKPINLATTSSTFEAKDKPQANKYGYRLYVLERKKPIQNQQ